MFSSSPRSISLFCLSFPPRPPLTPFSFSFQPNYFLTIISSMFSNSFDEEQERELEQEVEEERESERPASHKPHTNAISESLLIAVKNPTPPTSFLALPLRKLFQNTSLNGLVNRLPIFNYYHIHPFPSFFASLFSCKKSCRLATIKMLLTHASVLHVTLFTQLLVRIMRTLICSCDG